MIRPIPPLTIGTKTGNIINSKDPSLFCNTIYIRHAIITTKLVFIMSPIPFNIKLLLLYTTAPEPIIADVPTIAAPAPLNLN